MDQRNRWQAFRGRLLILVGTISLLTAMFLPDQIPEPFEPLLVVLGVGKAVQDVTDTIGSGVDGILNIFDNHKKDE